MINKYIPGIVLACCSATCVADNIISMRIDSELSSIFYGNSPDAYAIEGAFEIRRDIFSPFTFSNMRLQNPDLLTDLLPDIDFTFPVYEGQITGIDVIGDADFCRWVTGTGSCFSTGFQDKYSGTFDGQTLTITGVDHLGLHRQPLYNYTITATVVPAPAGDLVLKYSSYLATAFTDFDVIDITTDAAGNAYITGRANSTSGMPVVAGGFGDPDYVLPQSFVLKYSPDNVLLYSAFLQDAEISAIEIDNNGRAYLAGKHQGTGSSPYCNEWGIFIIRLSPDGSSMDYCSQYLPNFGAPTPVDIFIDKDGNSYVIGSYGGVNLPVTPGVFQPAPAGLDDVYVVKMAEDGSAVLGAFFLGGSGDDIGRSIYVANDGTIYVSGDTESLDFPLGTVNNGGYDAFVAKISNDGSVLKYSKLFGGSGEDRALSMAVDNKDSIYIGGATTSVDYPTTVGAVQPTFGGDADSLLFKLRSNNTIHYATYLGGEGVSNVQSIAVGPDGTLYLSGISGDPDFPVTTGAFQEIYPLTLRNAYFSAINTDGTALQYSTFLGSNIPNVGLSDSALTGAFALDIRNTGEVLIVGRTNSEDFPVSDDASQDTLRGRADFFLSIFNYSTLAIATPYLIADTTIGEYFQYSLSATGGSPPYEWFSQPKYLPIGINLSVGGVLEGTPTGIISSEKLYTYFLSETVQFLPIIVGVRDQDGRVAYKEILSEFSFALPNVEPTADAGIHRNVQTGDSIRLDGRTSNDTDGTIESYSWRQVLGSQVSLSGSNTSRPTFTAPPVAAVLTFELTVEDDQGATDSDTVTITVTVSSNNTNSVAVAGGGGGGGGCTINRQAAFDPVLLLLLAGFGIKLAKRRRFPTARLLKMGRRH